MITIICAVVFICSAVGLAYIFIGRLIEDNVGKSVAGLVAQPPEPTVMPAVTAAPQPTASPEPVVLEKYAALVEQNPDTIGWLKIEGTAIDNVVMWTPEEKNKYLHTDFYGAYSNRGSLYIDEKSDIWNSDNIIIYGHHMQSSAMFGDLNYYAGEDYWKEHKYIQFDTIYQEQTYEVVAAFYSRIMYESEEGFRYYQFIDAGNEDEFNEYVRFIEENQCYDTGVDISYGDQLITLSTCEYHVENGRFAVVARRIDPDTRLHEDEGDGEIVTISPGERPQAALPPDSYVNANSKRRPV